MVSRSAIFLLLFFGGVVDHLFDIGNRNRIALLDLVDNAARALAGAKTHAEILSAKDMANAVCAMAKGAARLARAKQASDDLVDAAHRTQADAIEIESRAKIRLAEEYEAAQDRGEVVGPHDGAKKRIPDGNSIATALDLGISAKDIHEGRMLRDASSNRSEASTSRA